MDQTEILKRGHIAGFDLDNMNCVFLNGFESCIVGVISGIDIAPRVCYDRQGMIEELIRHSSMTEEEADEYLSFNVEGTFTGEDGPVFLEIDEETWRRSGPQQLNPPGSPEPEGIEMS